MKLFDLNAELLSRTAVANEGKVHLGYMYAGDRTLSTARVMVRGALTFAPFFSRHLGDLAETALETSIPAVYAVHHDSQHGPEEVGGYIDAVYNLVVEAAAGRENSYFHADLSRRPRLWSKNEIETQFDPDAATAAFDTPEVAINPVKLATALKARVAAEPKIELCLRRKVVGVESDSQSPLVRSSGCDGVSTERFDHIVNALWDGRLAIDETMGIRANRAWLHRLKYGVAFKLPPQLSRLQASPSFPVRSERS